MARRPVRPSGPRDSFDEDDEPYDENPPPPPPSGLMVLGVWLVFAPPLLVAAPVLLAREPGGFAALMRVIAGGYTFIAVWVLWHTTRRYRAAPAARRPQRIEDGPDDEDEQDVWDEDAEPLA